jgi:hypothetical protein
LHLIQLCSPEIILCAPDRYYPHYHYFH